MTEAGASQAEGMSLSLSLSSLLFASAPGDTDAEVVQADPISEPDRHRDVVAPGPNRDYSIRVNRRARGVGVGVRHGLWGQGFGQSLHFDLPFGRCVGQFFGARVAGTFVHGKVDGVYDPVAFGTVGLFARSPVIAGVVRGYLGGGVSYGARVRSEFQERRHSFAVGGYLGLEAFVAPRVSISVEFGGQGQVGNNGLDGGRSVMGGVNIWLGALGRRRR